MSYFIKTLSDSEATGLLRGFYDEDIKADGVVSNTTRSFSLNPDAWAAWKGLVKSIRSKMRLRNYELITLAAAMDMGCTF